MSQPTDHFMDHIARQKLRAYHQGRCPTPFVPFESAALNQSIVRRFEQQVARHSNRPAVVTTQHRVRYDELNRSANRIAHAIITQCGTASEPVALLLEQGLAPIAAILGTLKAGKSYVPLEPLHPTARLQHVLADSEARLVVTHTAQFTHARELTSSRIPILNIDELPPHLPSDNPDVAIAPDELAYIMYTSGSTGLPKGVTETHRNVLHHMMRITNEYELCSADRQTLLRSYSFNGSVRDIFSVLLNGASLYPFNLDATGLPQLAAWLIEEEITLYRSVISFFRQFVHFLPESAAFPHLRVINVGGEPVMPGDVALFQQHFSDACVLLSGLGITEAGTVRHFYFSKESALPNQVVPIGYPVADLDVVLFDEQGHPVEPGQTGEIVVKSRYLSPGYWRQPDLTRTKFRPCPDDAQARLYFTGDLGRMLPDGCLLHLGRKDLQVKVRGHRVELAEIEAALLECDGLRETLVTAQNDGQGNPNLVAYYVADPDADVSLTALRQALAMKLPAVMLPSRFVGLEEMPLTAAGKVDRDALPVPDSRRPKLDVPFVSPTTPLEVALATIWSRVLGIKPIGIHDQFFDLGGHSLLATQVVSHIRAEFAIEISLTDVFDTPTISALADKLLASLLAEINPEV